MTDGGVARSHADDTAEGLQEGAGGANDAADRDEERAVVGGGLDVAEVLDLLPVAVFVLAPNHEVLHWNRGAEELCGTPREEVVGDDQVSTAFYHDGRRSMTLADKVVEAPETADREFGVRRGDADYTIYEDTSTMTDARGQEAHIWFTARPLYDEAGDLRAVVEMVHDRTEEVEEQAAVEGLVAEVSETLAALGDGDLDARADYRDDALDEELLGVLDQVNETAATLGRVVERVGTNADRLVELIDDSVERLAEIDDRATEQREALDRVVEEMASLSDSINGVADSAAGVADSATEARTAAQESQAAGEEAREATEEIITNGEQLLDRVAALEDRIENVVEVVDVIEQVADRTNMLALNANIEAARASTGDGSAEGFAVVAEEVKNLAGETQDQTDEITAQIDAIQAAAGETVDAVRSSNERLDAAGDQITDALDGLAEVSESVEEAAAGIEEVADATERQARTVEDVTGTVEGAVDSATAVGELVDDAESVAVEQESEIDSLTDHVDTLQGRRGD